MKISFKKLNAIARVPTRAHPTDSGLDVRSVESTVIPPHSRLVVGTGLSCSVPPGYEVQVRPRSGMAANNGITVLNTPGTIDCSYRGEIKVILYNTSNTSYEIGLGDKIAQLVVCPVSLCEVEEVDELTETKRGVGGLGSTGKK